MLVSTSTASALPSAEVAAFSSSSSSFSASSFSSSSSSSSSSVSSLASSEPWLHASHADDARTFGDDDLIAALDSLDLYIQTIDLFDAVATWEQNGADPAFNGGAAQKASAPLITEQCAKDMASSAARFSAAMRAQAATAFDVSTNMVSCLLDFCRAVPDSSWHVSASDVNCSCFEFCAFSLQLGSLRITSVKMANVIGQFSALDHIPFEPRAQGTLQPVQHPQPLTKAGKVALANALNALTAACAAPSALGKRKRTATAAAAP
jgi:hypothetical protein